MRGLMSFLLLLALAAFAASAGQSPADAPELFLPGIVSTAAHEMCLRFSPSMKDLYLVRASLDFQPAILRFTKSAGGWSAPVLASPAPGRTVSYPALTPDGRRMFFDARTAGNPGNTDIWMAHLRGDDWERPAPVPGVNSPSVEMHASVAASGNLYFCSNRPGGVGAFDLYVAASTPGGFALPVNLGRSVNSPENEFHPYVAPDESYLLFDAQRSDGLGSNDLFVAFRKGDGTWSGAMNLGSSINSGAGDMRPYVAPDGRTLYFCSNRSIGDPGEAPPSLEAFQRRANGPGSGSQDIYHVNSDTFLRLRPPAEIDSIRQEAGMAVRPRSSSPKFEDRP